MQEAGHTSRVPRVSLSVLPLVHIITRSNTKYTPKNLICDKERYLPRNLVHVILHHLLVPHAGRLCEKTQRISNAATQETQ